jgi:hypothetical protein
MDQEPGAELGQQQVPAMPAGTTSLPEDAPVGGLRQPSRRRWLLVASVALVGVSLVVGAGVLLAPGQPPVPTWRRCRLSSRWTSNRKPPRGGVFDRRT